MAVAPPSHPPHHPNPWHSSSSPTTSNHKPRPLAPKVRFISIIQQVSLFLFFSLLPLSDSFQISSKMTFSNQQSPSASAFVSGEGTKRQCLGLGLSKTAATIETAMKDLEHLANEIDTRASSNTPFTEIELQELQTSFFNIVKNGNGGSSTSNDMWKKLNDLFVNVGHLSHKDWERTGESAATLTEILLGNNDNSGSSGTDNDGSTLTEEFKHMFHRVLHEGNWEQALSHSNNNKPWAVLVTGVNGIRKTTSVYQSWFPKLLEEALIAPITDNDNDNNKQATLNLPTGHNSFFRQLDHMIATLSNNNFQQLYELTSQSHDFNVSTSTQPSKEVIQNYSNYKASIFKRYRTLSEILGITLINQAISQNLNVMIETSGRDVAMYHYIDMFFPKERYNKLVLHFEINDLSHAEDSVDRRMVKEMEDGVKVLNNINDGGVNVRDLINVNAGGPYGSEVLHGIQTDSNAVWETIVKKNNNEGEEDNVNTVGYDWYKASIKIDASANEDWTARAVLPNGEEGEVFTFEAPRKV